MPREYLHDDDLGAGAGPATGHGRGGDDDAAAAAPSVGARRSSWEGYPQLVADRRGPRYPLDVARSRFPFCIVWTALPGITALFPFIGHMGITDSRGVIYDFAGPFTIGVDDMAFGRPIRYLQLDPERVTRRPDGKSAAEAWDAAVDAGADVYCRRMHNIVCDNCHSHVARCLDVMAYDGRTGWNMVQLAVWTFFYGRYVSLGRALLQWGPLLAIVTVVLLVRFLAAK